MNVQPVIAALPKAREKSAAPKTGPYVFVLHSIRRFPDFMEVAYAAVSSECFYEECYIFALFMKKNLLQRCSVADLHIFFLPLVVSACVVYRHRVADRHGFEAFQGQLLGWMTETTTTSPCGKEGYKDSFEEIPRLVIVGRRSNGKKSHQLFQSDASHHNAYRSSFPRCQQAHQCGSQKMGGY